MRSGNFGDKANDGISVTFHYIVQQITFGSIKLEGQKIFTTLVT